MRGPKTMGAEKRPIDAIIAAVSAGAIILHLGLRWVPSAARFADLPLQAAMLGGIPLIAGIVRKLRQGEAGSDLLAALSMATAAAMGEWLVAAILVVMLSGGQTLEQLASRRASRVLDALARRMPQAAHRKEDGRLVELGLSDIRLGDLLVVLPHELCPVDGTVAEGRGTMDESYLTGEPFQIGKTPGSKVLSGAINGENALTIRAERLPSDSRYARIMKVMQDAEHNRPRLRRLGDQIALWYAPLAIGIALAAWLASGDAGRFLSVLVIATPCPLLIAIPVAVIGAVSLAASRGIIVRDAAVLERIVKCRTVILDKTGTLTFGKPALTGLEAAPGADAPAALRLASGLERYSRHPLAAAIVEAARSRGLHIPEAAEVAERPGAGLSGVVEGRRVRITGRNFLSPAERAGLPVQTEGLECVVMVEDRPAATLRFRDAPRPESAPFLGHLLPTHGMGKIMLVSGDRESEVRYLAAEVGITEIAAEKSPEEKLVIVRRETGLAQTLFIGDGINDAPALAAATVGVAIGPNSDVTTEAAGAVIMTASIAKLDELLHIGERMRAVALQSAIGGIALSVLGMGLAAFGHLPPVEGAIAQELIDLAAILNAVRAALPPGRLTDF